MKGNQPLVITGMACRFPGGASTPEKFWELLVNQEDAMVEVPNNRWDMNRFGSDNPATKGKMYNKLGAFLKEPINEFDPGFFSIPPREAECLDPQQRLLLEVSWEALENAGQNVKALAGKNVGVFVGGFTVDHLINQMSAQGREHIGSHTAVGSTLTVLSNRVSHTFDFRGPSISMDTACSSSLVAFHQACLAVRNGDCEMSLVGGVNVMLRPEYSITMCKGGFLAKDSHCKSFDAAADGYARGEGAGVVIIKTLEKALADKDPILAIVHGSGVNQDGRTNGITVPNPDSQKALIQRVLDESEVTPADVSYIEAHGTGTPVGDPLEAEAIGMVYGQGRQKDNPVVMGSLKSNVGHMEAAAGIAGVIKSVLCLQEKQVPALVTLNKPNPNIPFDELNVKLANETLPLNHVDGKSYVGINSFGYGGTNAHALLGSVKQDWLESDWPTHGINQDIIPFSANSKEALDVLLHAYLDLFSKADESEFLKLVRCLQSRRSHLKERVCIVANSKEIACDTLGQLIQGNTTANAKQGRLVDEKNKGLVFVYTGMGPQWWGMGQELYKTEPVFKQAVDKVDTLFAELSGYSIRNEMMKDEASSRMAVTEISAPANFVLQVALTELLKSQGVEPSAVIGHSLGEISSIYVAGGVTLQDAINVVYYRSAIIQQIAGTGGMLAVAISEEVANSLIEDPEKLSIAAVNSPSMVTFAGDEELLQELDAVFQSEGIFSRLLKVEVPFHSPMVASLKDQVYDTLSNLSPVRPHTSIYSTVEGELANDAVFDVHYWYRNMRQPVLFENAVQKMVDDGYKVFVEIGPHPVMSASLKECFKSYKSNAISLGTLKRGEPEATHYKLSLADIAVASDGVDWQSVNGAIPNLPLPNYPWQRELLWSEPTAAKEDRIAPVTSPYLGVRKHATQCEWSLEINPNLIPYIEDHRIEGVAVLPGAAYLESFSQLYQHVFDAKPNLYNVRFNSPVLFDDADWPNVRIVYNENNRCAEIHQISQSGAAKLVAKADFLEPLQADRTETNFKKLCQRFGMDDLDDKSSTTNDAGNQSFYELTDLIGLGYSRDFRSLTQIHREGKEVFAKAQVKDTASAEAHILYPPALDACFQSMLAVLFAKKSVNGAVVPVSVGNVNVHGPIVDSVWVYAKLVGESENQFTSDLKVYNESGELLVEIKALACDAVNKKASYVTVEQIDSRTSETDLRVLSDFNIPKIDSPVLVLSPDKHVSTTCAGIDQVTSFFLEDFSDALKELPNLLTEDVHHVVYVPGDRISPKFPDTLQWHMLQVSELVALLGEQSSQLTFVTRLAHCVDGQESIDPAQTAFMSFTRVVANEHSSLNVTLVDVEYFTSENLQKAFSIAQGSGQFSELVFRNEFVYEPKLAPSSCLTQEYNIELSAHRNAGYVVKHQPFLGRKAVTAIADKAVNSEQLSRYPLVAAKTIGSMLIGSGEWGEDKKPGMVVACAELTSQLLVNADNVIELTHSNRFSHESYAVSAFCYGFAEWILQQIEQPKAGDVLVLEASEIGYSVAQLLTGCGADIYLVQTPGVDVYGFGQCDNAIYTKLSQLANIKTAAVLMVGPVNRWSEQAYLGEVCSQSVVVETDALLERHNKSTNEQIDNAALVIKPNGALLLNQHKHSFTFALDTILTKLDSGALKPIEATIADSSLWCEQLAFNQVASLNQARVVADYSAYNAIDPNKTYIVTGGLGGVGKKVAEWLIDKGAGQLVLVGRSGIKTDADGDFVKSLRSRCPVFVETCDVACADQVMQLVETYFNLNDCTLGGVFHCAGTLDDRPVIELTAGSLDGVIQAKAKGAYNFHVATSGNPLDLFVMFSSIAADVGNSHQASYVTANGYLDALAVYRKQLGLPALSINWGAIDDVGMVAESDLVRTHFSQMGVHPIPVSEAIAVMDEGIKRGLTRFTYANIDWNKWSRVEKVAGQLPKFSELVDQDAAMGEESGIAAELVHLSPEDRVDVLSELLAEVIGSELNAPADQIERNLSLVELGVDSLLATSIQLGIETQFGVEVTVMELSSESSVDSLASKILDRISI